MSVAYQKAFDHVDAKVANSRPAQFIDRHFVHHNPDLSSGTDGDAAHRSSPLAAYSNNAKAFPSVKPSTQLSPPTPVANPTQPNVAPTPLMGAHHLARAQLGAPAPLMQQSASQPQLAQYAPATSALIHQSNGLPTTYDITPAVRPTVVPTGHGVTTWIQQQPNSVQQQQQQPQQQSVTNLTPLMTAHHASATPSAKVVIPAQQNVATFTHEKPQPGSVQPTPGFQYTNIQQSTLAPQTSLITQSSLAPLHQSTGSHHVHQPATAHVHQPVAPLQQSTKKSAPHEEEANDARSGSTGAPQIVKKHKKKHSKKNKNKGKTCGCC